MITVALLLTATLYANPAVTSIDSRLVCAIEAAAGADTLDPSTLRTLFDRGAAFGVFLDTATARRKTWRDNYRGSRLAEDPLTRARAVTGTWYLLVIADASCGDSANTIPYLARLVDSVPALSLRIVSSRVGRQLMEARRTPDGRAATPTVLLLDAGFREVGCWVERPLVLQQWIAANKGRLSDSELGDRKMAFYKWDAGEQTIREVVDMLETAAAGRRRCAAGG